MSGQPLQYKENLGNSLWHTKLNAGLDALWDADTAFTNTIADLSTLINNWAIEDQIVTMIPVTCTYSDADTFTLPGDYTSRFAAGAVVQVQVAAGMAYSTVASSSYAAPTTTVNLSDTVLTDPITRVYAVATRDGLWPNGPGYIVAADYGTDQAALEAADAVAASAGKQLVIGRTYSITSTPANPLTATLKILPGGTISIANGVTLTINGTLDAGLYQIFSCTGTGKVVYGVGAVKEVYPQWWGATGDGTTDDFNPVQAAITAALSPSYVSGAGTPIIPVTFIGQFSITSCLNAANSRGVQLQGGGTEIGRGSNIIGKTGAGHAILDVSGSVAATVKGLNFVGVTSTLGIITGYTTVDGANRQVFRDITIYMPSSPTANNDLGTVGLAVKSGEDITYDHVEIYADMPMVLSTTDDFSWITGGGVNTFTLTSDYATYDTMSQGVNTFVGDCSLVANGARSSIALYNANTLDLGNAYLANAGTGTAAIFCNGCYNLSWRGHAETFPSLMVIPGYLHNANINCQFSPNVTTSPILVMDPVVPGSTGGDLSNSRISVTLPYGTAAMCFISSTDATHPGFIDNCDLYAYPFVTASIATVAPNVNLLTKCRNVNINLVGGRTQYGPSQLVSIPYVNATKFASAHWGNVLVPTATPTNLFTFPAGHAVYLVWLADATQANSFYTQAWAFVEGSTATIVNGTHSGSYIQFAASGLTISASHTIGATMNVGGGYLRLSTP
jgi:hypothetical protein